MPRLLFRTALLAASLAATVVMPTAWAQDTSPVGLWKNIDDVTGQPKALVRITESNGVAPASSDAARRQPVDHGLRSRS